MANNYMTAPSAVGPYSRWYQELFDESDAVAVATGWQSFFGRAGSQTFYTDDALAVDLDIIRADDRLAKMVLRGTGTRLTGTTFENTNNDQWSTNSRVFPMIKEEGDITADQTLFRVPGETPYAMRARTSRLREIARRKHMEQVRRIIRTNELLASQSILEGQQDAILDTADTNFIYDFQRNSSLTVTLGTKWTNASADIMGNVDTACDTLNQLGFVMPNVMVMGGGAADAFVKDSDTQALADNRRFELIQVSQTNPVPAELAWMEAGGFVAFGSLKTPKGYKVWVFTYPRFYTNLSGTKTPYMPTDKVLVCKAGARADRLFGPSDVLPSTPSRDRMFSEMFGFSSEMAPMPPNILNQSATINPAMFHFDAYTNDQWTAVTLRTECAPIFCTTQTDAYYLMEGVV